MLLDPALRLSQRQPAFPHKAVVEEVLYAVEQALFVTERIQFKLDPFGRFRASGHTRDDIADGMGRRVQGIQETVRGMKFSQNGFRRDDNKTVPFGSGWHSIGSFPVVVVKKALPAEKKNDIFTLEQTFLREVQNGCRY